MSQYNKIGDVLLSSLKNLNTNCLYALFSLKASWHLVVGQGLAAHSAPLRVTRGTLIVVVEDQEYVAKMKIHQENILSLIRSLLKDETTVKKIAFTVGNFDDFAVADKKILPLTPKREVISSSERKKFAKEVAVVEDPFLRKLCLKWRLTASTHTKN